MGHVLPFNRPYGVICQFSRDGTHPTLADYIAVPDVYPAGRMDTDSEGSVLLTDEGKLQHRITDPKHKLPKAYWVQVKGVPDETALSNLRRGVLLKDGMTLPLPRRMRSRSLHHFGRAIRRYASASIFRPAGWNCRYAKGGTARCGV